MLKLPNRPAMPLTFKGDNGMLWEFQLGEYRPTYDHRNGHFASGLDRTNHGDVVAAVTDVATKLMGDSWRLSPNEQVIIDLLAKELPSGADVPAMALRFRLRKYHGIEAEEVAHLLSCLEPRHVFRSEGPDDDLYRLTVPGLFASSEGRRAERVTLSVLKVLEAEFETKQIFTDFSLDQVLLAGELDESDRLFTAHAIPILKLSPNSGTKHASDPTKISWTWRRPDDVELLAIGGPTLTAFWKATVTGSRVERPWLTAPLRLKETIVEVERRSRVGEVYVPLTAALTRADLPPSFALSAIQSVANNAAAVAHESALRIVPAVQQTIGGALVLSALEMKVIDELRKHEDRYGEVSVLLVDVATAVGNDISAGQIHQILVQLQSDGFFPGKPYCDGEQFTGRLPRATASVAPASVTSSGGDRSGTIQRVENRKAMGDSKKVFIIHGRNTDAKKEMGIFLKAMGLSALNFEDVRASLKGTPTVADIVTKGMTDAQGVVALFTPDEYAVLRPEHRFSHDKGDLVERWQARPNVIFEAGMAFGKDRDRVIFVTLGSVTLFTDVAGIHTLRPTNDPTGDRRVLRDTLKAMDCAVDESHDWMNHGDFETCVKGLSGVLPSDPFR